MAFESSLALITAMLALPVLQTVLQVHTFIDRLTGASVRANTIDSKLSRSRTGSLQRGPARVSVPLPGPPSGGGPARKLRVLEPKVLDREMSLNETCVRLKSHIL